MPAKDESKESPFMTQRQAAEMLHVNPRTLRRRVESDGFPPPVKLGDRVLYLRKEVIAYINRKLNGRDGVVELGA